MSRPGRARTGARRRRAARAAFVALGLVAASPALVAEILVEPQSGQLLVVESDLMVPAGAVGLELRRWLVPAGGERGMLGARWRTNWESRLQRSADGYELVAGNVRVRYLRGSTAGDFRSRDGERLRRGADGSLVRYRMDGASERFDGAGRLVERDERNGNKIAVRYAADGRPISVEGPRGSYLRFSYDGRGRVTQVGGSDGQAVEYRYREDALSAVFARGSRVFGYHYDDLARVTRIEASALGGGRAFEYDVTGRVVRQRWADGDSESYGYDDGAREVRVTGRDGGVFVKRWSADGQRLQVTDPLGHTSLVVYDGHGRPLETTGPTGLVARLAYDELGRLISSTDPQGATTRIEYVPDTALVSATVHPDGTVEAFGYDAQRNLTTVAIGDTTVASLSYYSNGLLASVSQLGGGARTFTYDLTGRVTTVTDALGHSVRYHYDRRGHLVREINPLGGVTSRRYDDAGRLLAITEPDGETTHFEYDGAGRRSAVIDPSGARLDISYDALGRRSLRDGPRIESREADGLQTTIWPDGRRETVRLDAAGQIVEHLDDRGRRSTFGYDPLGRLIHERLPGGREISYAYTPAGRLSAVRDADGVPITFEWDPGGRLLARVDADDRGLRYRYDPLGRTAEIIDGGGNALRYGYDPRGFLSQVRTPEGVSTRYEHDAEGRLVAVHHPGGGATHVEYDAMGNPVRVVDRAGGETRYRYDQAGDLVAIVDALGRATRFDASAGEALTELPDGRTLAESYDASGALVGITDGNTQVRYEYDADGRLSAVSLPAVGRSIRYRYDAQGRLGAVRATDGREIEYRYDDLDRVSAIALPDSGEIRLAYDRAGRLRSVAYPNGVTGAWRYERSGEVASIEYHDRDARPLVAWRYRYDALGNPVEVERSPGGTRWYAYDRDGQLVEEIDAERAVGYSYTPDGDRESRSDGAATVRYGYDAAGRLESVGAERFSHDALGNLVQRSHSRGTSHYEFDVLGQLVRVTTPGAQLEFGYTPNGERHWRRGPDGLTYFVHDRDNLLEELGSDGETRALYVHGPGIDWPLALQRGGRSYFYHLDANGNVGLLTDDRGTMAASYQVDAFGRVVAQSGDVRNPLLFASREYEPELGLYYFRARYYDPELGRFLSPDPVAADIDDPRTLNRYVYALNAPTRFSDPLGLHTIDYQYFWDNYRLSRSAIDKLVRAEFQRQRRPSVRWETRIKTNEWQSLRPTPLGPQALSPGEFNGSPRPIERGTRAIRQEVVYRTPVKRAMNNARLAVENALLEAEMMPTSKRTPRGMFARAQRLLERAPPRIRPEVKPHHTRRLAQQQAVRAKSATGDAGDSARPARSWERGGRTGGAGGSTGGGGTGGGGTGGAGGGTGGGGAGGGGAASSASSTQDLGRGGPTSPSDTQSLGRPGDSRGGAPQSGRGTRGGAAGAQVSSRPPPEPGVYRPGAQYGPGSVDRAPDPGPKRPIRGSIPPYGQGRTYGPEGGGRVRPPRPSVAGGGASTPGVAPAVPSGPYVSPLGGAGLGAAVGAGISAAHCAWMAGGWDPACSDAATQGALWGAGTTVAVNVGANAVAATGNALGFNVTAAPIVTGVGQLGLAALVGGLLGEHVVRPYIGDPLAKSEIGSTIRRALLPGGAQPQPPEPRGLEGLDPATRDALASDLQSMRQQLADLGSLATQIEEDIARLQELLGAVEEPGQNAADVLDRLSRTRQFLSSGGDGFKGVGEYCAEIPSMGQDFELAAEATRKYAAQAEYLIDNAGDWPGAKSILRDGYQQLVYMDREYQRYLSIKSQLWTALGNVKTAGRLVEALASKRDQLIASVEEAGRTLREARALRNTVRSRARLLDDGVRGLGARLDAPDPPYFSDAPATFVYEWNSFKRDARQELAGHRQLVATANASVLDDPSAPRGERRSAVTRQLERLEQANLDAESGIDAELEAIGDAYAPCRSLPGGPGGYITRVEQVWSETKSEVVDAAKAFESRYQKVRERLEKRETRVEQIKQLLPKLEKQIQTLRDSVGSIDSQLASGRLTERSQNELERKAVELRADLRRKVERRNKATELVERGEEKNEDDQEDIDFAATGASAASSAMSASNADSEGSVPTLSIAGLESDVSVSP